MIAVAPDRYTVSAQGTLDRRPLKLLEPAIVTRDGDGWQLAPTKLAFAGGEGSLAGGSPTTRWRWMPA